MSTWLHLLTARSHPGNRPHLGGRGKAAFLPGQRRALRAGAGRRTGSAGVTKPKELDIGAILSGGAGQVGGMATGTGVRSRRQKMARFVRQPGHGRYIWKPNKFVWKRPFPRSQQRQGSERGRAAGSLQPRRRLRGSEAAPLPSGESCARPGVSGAARPALERHCRPRQRQPCPHPSRELETEIGECWRAPAGAVRGLQQVPSCSGCWVRPGISLLSCTSVMQALN
ncbi:uncharacterized protein LOC119705778 [Motacilla alba alba]|uniref:uncharacterized protein LOC119705778 n=1 Tax=Motacilla alba alba TaxID=1094192 RepID=UPI0018D51F96|nr:uncharacterized protein LOC119705778 [Motacilla alba alba]